MFCPNCGKELPNDAMFCEECGTNLRGESTPVSEPVLINERKSLKPQGSIAILVLGIIALRLSVLGIPGIILAAIALSRANAFIAQNGSVWGLAKVGRILAKVAIPVSILYIVIWVVYFVLCVVYGTLLRSELVSSATVNYDPTEIATQIGRYW